MFVGGLFAIFVIAALAFDIGLMLVERRDQQNAADAAALAGARYVADADLDPVAKANAESAARAIGIANGFDDADSTEAVTVHIPPISGPFTGAPGFIEVVVGSTRPSVFGGIIGVGGWNVGARAVAANQQGLSLPFGMLALNPTECKAIHISGSGTVYSASNVQSNSSCPLSDGGGLSRTGQGTLVVDTPDALCRSSGGIQDQGSGEMDCTQVPNSFAYPDPLKSLLPPFKPGAPINPRQVFPASPTEPIPPGCPGGSQAATDAQPQQGCRINENRYNNKVWEFGPGYYPGGISLESSITIRLLPGVYYLGGGGFNMTSNSSVITIADPNDPPLAGEGVLFYNTSGPNAPAGKINMSGQGSTVDVLPLDVPETSTYYNYNGMIIFQDRTININGDDVEITGGSNTDPSLSVRGLVYVPAGDIKVTGNGGTMTMDQVIASTFKVTGSGNFSVLREYGVDAMISGVGLVE